MGEVVAKGAGGLTLEQFGAIPEPLREQARKRGFEHEEIDRFAWEYDPFGNLYCTAYDCSSKRPMPKIRF